MKKLKGQVELETAGFGSVKALGTKPQFGPAVYGKWFEAMLPGSNEVVLVLRQSGNCWHTFGGAAWTASSTSVERCQEGGLGDAIGTDGELKVYARLVNRAPSSWCDRFEGLWAAKSQVAA